MNAEERRPLTDQEALDWVIEQLGTEALLGCVDRGKPGVLARGPNGELIVVNVRVAPYLLVQRLEDKE